jgi:DNA polymerase
MSKEIKEILLDVRTHLQHQKELGNYHLPKGETPMAKTASNKGGKIMLNELKEHIGDCNRCRLSEERNNVVFGVGNPEADLMFVGEGPGSEEDKQGKPFVGRAGKLLDKIIEAMGLKREDVFIANVVKCRPPKNRNPEPDEIATCIPFLEKQIEIIDPKIIVCLGTFAAQTLLATDEKISKLRGQLFEHKERKVIPTYHPAFLLRNPSMKRPVWEDMQKVMKHL